MSSRPGFTLLDTLLAIIVIDLALLGLTGAVSASERLLARGRASSRAAVRGRELLVQLARPDSICSAAGERTLPGAHVTWASLDRPSLRQVTVVVATGPGMPAESLGTVVRCA